MLKPVASANLGHSNKPPLSPKDHHSLYPFGLSNDLGNAFVIIKPSEKHNENLHQDEIGITVHPPHGLSHSPVSNVRSATPLTLLVPKKVELGHSSQSLTMRNSPRLLSASSSILDLSVESEALERAIRTNETSVVIKMLEVHHRKFAINPHAPVYLRASGDKSSTSSCDSRSQSSSRAGDAPPPLKKTPNLPEKTYHISEKYADRLESITVDEQDVPWIFRSALHVSIWSNAVDVARLLLHYGVDPNAGGVKPFVHEYYGSDTNSSPSPCMLSPMQGGFSRPGSREERRSTASEIFFGNLLSPEQNAKRPHSVSSCRSRNSSFRSFHGSFRRQQRLARQRSLERPDYAPRYTPEYLYTLPPLFVAAAQGAGEAARMLVRHGARVDVRDTHGNTPLHVAVGGDAAASAAAIDCVAALLEGGARVDAPNQDGVAPVDVAPELVAMQREIVDEAMLAFHPARGRLAKSGSAHTVAARLDSAGSGSRAAGILRRLQHDLGSKAKGGGGGGKRSTRENSPDDSVFMSEHGHGEAPSTTSDTTIILDNKTL
ncbi:PREDICTED: uncharacterized protein LOC106810214 [Priapulus caudatus]|uniref:Uncharacterized protein LOC106810214 n=1 Tax=Priapulus caudatus TaxID=37621 RepID=A0ABM1E9W3_PRICU|nr:PREDICTED: uncharacterized protein LOC106810214 [Priapulus caudatus]